MNEFRGLWLGLVLAACAVAPVLASEIECGYGALFAAPEVERKVHYGRGRPMDVKHIRLDISVDFDAESVRGSVTHTLAPVGEALKEVVLDSVAIDVQSVLFADGRSLDFEVTEDKLKIYLPEPAEAGRDLTIKINYSVTVQQAGCISGRPGLVTSAGKRRFGAKVRQPGTGTGFRVLIFLMNARRPKLW